MPQATSSGEEEHDRTYHSSHPELINSSLVEDPQLVEPPPHPLNAAQQARMKQATSYCIVLLPHEKPAYFCRTGSQAIAVLPEQAVPAAAWLRSAGHLNSIDMLIGGYYLQRQAYHT